MNGLCGHVVAGGAGGRAGGNGAIAGRWYDESEGFNLKDQMILASSWAHMCILEVYDVLGTCKVMQQRWF